MAGFEEDCDELAVRKMLARLLISLAAVLLLSMSLNVFLVYQCQWFADEAKAEHERHRKTVKDYREFVDEVQDWQRRK
jgi:phage FluMu gp28-like protein